MSFEFNSLPYATNSLEPYIDAKTMEVHHGKHHRTYYDKFMGFIDADSSLSELKTMSIEDIMKTISKYPVGIRNNAGGYYNHNVFWQCLRSPQEGGGAPVEGSLKDAIDRTYGSYESFQKKFEEAALGRFGSGFVWLIVTEDKNLAIISTANQDNPLMDIEAVRGTPLMALDVWEHAYYLKYQNRRPEYVQAFWKVLFWKHAEEIYEAQMAS